MTVEQRADNAAAQHAGESLLPDLRLKVRDNFIVARKATNVQALFISWATAKTGVVRSVIFLQAFFSHE